MNGEASHFEIGVPDVERARRFFGGVLGWSFDKTGHGARITNAELSGGIHTAAGPEIQLYFTVADLDLAAKRIVELGGQVDEGGEEGPAGRWLFSCRDDQGVPFGLHQPTRESRGT